MICSEIDSLLSAYVDRELGAHDHAEVEHHLTTCARCARELARLSELDRDLGRALHVPDRAAFIERLVQSLPHASVRRAIWLPIAVAAAAGFLLAYLMFGHGATRSSGDPPLGQLMLATGTVQVRDGRGDWHPLAAGSTLAAGATLRTLPLVKCALDLSDGSEVRLNADTEVTLLSVRHIALERGQIFSHVTPSTATFAVRTEQATVEVLGTTLDISHSPRGTTSPDKPDRNQVRTQVTVLDGRARLGAETIPAGHRCAMVNGTTQKPTAEHDLVLMTNWVNEILVLKGRDDPEFSTRVNDLLAMLGRVKMEFLYESEIRSLGDHCALPLARYLRSTRPEDDSYRRKRAAAILSDIAVIQQLPDLVPLLGDGDQDVRAAIARALQRLTGTTLDFDESYWRGTDCGRGQTAWRAYLEEPAGERK